MGLVHYSKCVCGINHGNPPSASSINKPIVPSGSSNGKRRDIAPHASRKNKVIHPCRRMEHSLATEACPKVILPASKEIQGFRDVDIPPLTNKQKTSFPAHDLIHRPKKIAH